MCALGVSHLLPYPLLSDYGGAVQQLHALHPSSTLLGVLESYLLVSLGGARYWKHISTIEPTKSEACIRIIHRVK